ncbi:hypothetical protein [Roseovarius sp.]|uniref:hypothetical protein n=1 Tax=Roseovarius sp. TaxID=1486281 RepID=UPI002632C3B4|nr:hypothetical protein [Roseovarius sp.]MDM8166984.1 hypothetical protein [Roseovarius sp.]
MEIFGDRLSGEQYQLMMRLKHGDVRHFDETVAEVLIARGLAVETDNGALTATEEGRNIRRMTRPA